MEILIGLALAVALLYFWLIGHWFARILMGFLLVAAFLTVGGTTASSSTDGNMAAILFGALAGGTLGWLAAGWPVYYWRAKARQHAAAAAKAPRARWGTSPDQVIGAVATYSGDAAHRRLW